MSGENLSRHPVGEDTKILCSTKNCSVAANCVCGNVTEDSFYF